MFSEAEIEHARAAKRPRHLQFTLYNLIFIYYLKIDVYRCLHIMEQPIRKVLYWDI